MQVSLIYVQDENDNFVKMYESVAATSLDTLVDVAKYHAKVACMENGWDFTYVKVVRLSFWDNTAIVPSIHMEYDETFEYVFDHSDGEEQFNLWDYVNQVRKDYASGIGNPFN